MPSGCSRSCFGVLLIPLVVALMLTGGSPLRADDTVARRNLVQMPVAVNQLRKAGVPQRYLESMAGAMNDGSVSPGDFNLILHAVPYFSEDIGSIAAVSNFTVMQYERGLTGEKLASALRNELRSRGLLRTSPLPVESGYVPDRAKKIIATVKRRRRQRRQRDEPPEQPRRDRRRSPRRGGAPPPTGPTGPTGPGRYP